MLLTRRLERARLRPLGFVANEYALAVWGIGDVGLQIARGGLSLPALFDEDMLGDDLEAWLAESALMKRTFRTCAIIAGLIERRFPGKEKSRRQVTVSTDLIYDVLRRHQPDHVLLRAARADAATGLLDIRRLGEMLSRIRGRIIHKPLERVSPLAVPVMLEIGREMVYGEAVGRAAAGGGGRTGEGGDGMRRRCAFFLLLVLLAPPSGAQVAPNPAFPLHDRYVVAAVNGQHFGADASLTVKRRSTDKSLFAEGDAGCGWWAAAVELGGSNRFRVVGVKTTSWECPHAAEEKQFLAALKRVTRWRMEGRSLILEGDKIRLRLNPLPFDNWI